MKWWYGALDVSLSGTSICIVDGAGRIAKESKVPTIRRDHRLSRGDRPQLRAGRLRGRSAVAVAGRGPRAGTSSRSSELSPGI